MICAKCGSEAMKADKDGVEDCPVCDPDRYQDCHSALNTRAPEAPQWCGFWLSVGDSPQRDYCGGCGYGPGETY